MDIDKFIRSLEDATNDCRVILKTRYMFVLTLPNSRSVKFCNIRQFIMSEGILP